MATSNRKRARRLGLAAWAVLLSLVIAGTGRAQFSPSIPYSPFNGQNLTFSYPTVVNPSLPNQSRLM